VRAHRAHRRDEPVEAAPIASGHDERRARAELEVDDRLAESRSEGRQGARDGEQRHARRDQARDPTRGPPRHAVRPRPPAARSKVARHWRARRAQGDRDGEQDRRATHRDVHGVRARVELELIERGESEQRALARPDRSARAGREREREKERPEPQAGVLGGEAKGSRLRMARQSGVSAASASPPASAAGARRARVADRPLRREHTRRRARVRARASPARVPGAPPDTRGTTLPSRWRIADSAGHVPMSRASGNQPRHHDERESRPDPGEIGHGGDAGGGVAVDVRRAFRDPRPPRRPPRRRR
jgi:hypothetical protein